MNLFIFRILGRSSVYGIGTYIEELTKALRHSHINVSVLNLMSDRPCVQSEEIDGIRHWHFPIPIQGQQINDIEKQEELYYRNVVCLLRLHIKDKENLVFHLNNGDRNSKLSNDLRKAFDCKIVGSVHYLRWSLDLLGNRAHFQNMLSVSETDLNDRLKTTISNSYRNERQFFEIADHVVCLSENTRHILQDDYQTRPDKISIVYNGLTDNSIRLDKSVLRQKYYIPDIPVILFAGRLDDVKGLKYALRAFRKVIDVQPCHFIIAGNGIFDPFLEECEDVWTQITWTGLISKEKLYDFYSIADIGVMPSFHEQCSYVAIEMMMHGLPIVGSTSTGLKEMIEDGETGLHVPVIEYNDKTEIDTTLLAENMLYLLQNPQERKRMGRNARKRYESLYTVELMRRHMLALYENL